MLVAGCQREEKVNAQLAPRAAARTFVQAMVSGDEQAMRNASVGDEPSAQVLAAQARQNAAHERLAAAAKAKFGDEKLVLAGRRGDDHYASRLATIDAEPEHIYDNGTATLGEGRNTIHLKLVGSAWKVDRARQVPPSGEGSAQYIKMVDAIRAADDRVAAAIGAGKYATAAEARSDLVKQMGEAVRESMGMPQTRPATGPASRPVE